MTTTLVEDAVRSLYERYPYPPPEPDLDAFRDGRQMMSGSPRYFFHQYWPRRPFTEKLDVLVAGCGTSQAVKYALQQPDLRVTGIDVCAASLARAEAWRERYQLENLTLRELPLERAEELEQSFDLVISTGVLHHLPDPDAGLRVLRNVTRPEGALHLGVYATYGRRGVIMLQEYCRRLGLEANDQTLAELMATISEMPAEHPLAIFMSYGDDLRSPGAVADAFLHPLDRPLTVPEVYAWLDRCGVRLMRWQHQAPYLPVCGRPATTPHAERLATLPPAEQHAAMELYRGNMIIHAFMACRDDRPETDHAVDFEGDAWRGSVPSRFEGAEVRAGPVPEGAAAVLHNRGHHDPDLVLALTPAHARLCALIDGQRTIDDIMAASGIEATPEKLALYTRSFFRALWDHDQVLVRIPE
ncbi:MAG: class I SAM-dependent methyltransferase [Phycisphaerae bacterium]|nr:class I SAM-dependent methyltransferase [Phycisphaerae bacterium]